MKSYPKGLQRKKGESKHEKKPPGIRDQSGSEGTMMVNLEWREGYISL
jgi:hypothetical protein